MTWPPTSLADSAMVVFARTTSTRPARRAAISPNRQPE
jgi:hypothetical protein